MVTYLHSAELGAQYDTEEGEEGHRREFIESIPRRLQVLLAGRDAALARSKATAGVGAQITAKSEYMDFVRKITVMKAKFARQLYFFKDDGTVDWTQSARTVVYEPDPALQAMTRVYVHDGRFFKDAGHTQSLDTSGMTTAKAGPGWAIYVMSANGHIHVTSHVVGHRHHSSLLAGESVAAAGELKVRKGGFLEEITNKTGHYQAKLAHYTQMLHQLEKSNVRLNQVVIWHVYYAGKVEKSDDFRGVQAFSDHLAQSEFMTEFGVSATDFEYAKLLGYCTALPKHIFDAKISTHGWRWVTDPEFNAGKRGVVRTADGTAVPHKDVRKWLKAQGISPYHAIQSGVGR